MNLWRKLAIQYSYSIYMQPPSIAHLPLPALVTDADGTLRSSQFGDVYFSREGGAQETEHVFLKGNHLPERWQHRESFTIGELGFGSGLNFLVTWRKFLETAPPSHRLHYLSFEQYPLTREMVENTHRHAGFDRGDEPFNQLLRHYPLRLPGFHRVHFDRVVLTLAFGDARALLPQLEEGAVDAWFLDGFSPAKNPELWGEDILREVARLSAPEATLATYSVASVVRHGLETHGFRLEKQKGFGRKKEMLIGSLSGRCARPTHVVRQTIVIGGGIAGCTVARALAERGIHVTLLERDKVASGASGNAAAVLYPQITKTWRAATWWHFTAYGFALRQLRRWKEEGLEFGFESPGMIKIPASDDEVEKLRGVNGRLGIDPDIATWLEGDAASEKLGLPLNAGGTWFPQGSWIRPAELCRALTQHANITLHEQTEITALARSADGWCAESAHGETFSAAAVVLCNAEAATRFIPGLAMGISAGQVSIIPATAAATKLRTILCHKGYMIPQGDAYLIGATYDHHDFSCAVTEHNHQRNLDALEKALPGWLLQKQIAGGRTSLRATTHDRLPHVGHAGDGLYTSTGFGSRGMVSAPLAAEIIASAIGGEIVPLTSELRKAIHPLRRQTSNISVRAKPSTAKNAS